MIDLLIARLEREHGERRGTALLVGDAARFEPLLRARGWAVRVAPREDPGGSTPEACDLVLAENLLVRDPWARWALQRIHHALRVGGLVVLSEPNRLDLATPGGVLYVLRRGAREVWRRLRAASRPPASVAPAPSSRRLSLPEIETMLERLRFTRLDAGYDRRGGWGAMLPARFAPRSWVVARALPSVAGPASGWPERERHVRAYEREQAHLLSIRDRWTRDHPRWIVRSPQEFDPGGYAGSTVLVLAPHPDDEVIGAGGALLRLVRAGARVVCLQATDGSAGAALEGLPESERREARIREATAVSGQLGIAGVEFWRADNRDFRVTPQLVERMRGLLERERPALILVPFVTEAHADHTTLSVILARAIEGLHAPPAALVLGYEVWSVVPATHVHDITPLMGDLESLLFQYDYAMRVDDFVHFCADRALYHGFQLPGGPRYLEAFHGVPAGEYPDLVRSVVPSHGH